MIHLYFIFIVCIALCKLEAMQSVKQFFGKAQRTILTNASASFHDTSRQSSKSVSFFRASLPIGTVAFSLWYVYNAQKNKISRKSLSASSVLDHEQGRMITDLPVDKATLEAVQNKLDFDLGTAIFKGEYESALKLLGQGANPNAFYAPLDNKPLLWVAIDVAESAIMYPTNNSWRNLELLLEKGARIEDKQWGSVIDYTFKKYYRLIPIFQEYAKNYGMILRYDDLDCDNRSTYAENMVSFLFGIAREALPYETEKNQKFVFKKLLSLPTDEWSSFYVDSACREIAKLFVQKSFGIDIHVFEEAISNNRLASVKELLKHPKLDLTFLSSEILQKSDVSIQQCIHEALIQHNIQLAVPVSSFFQLDPF